MQLINNQKDFEVAISLLEKEEILFMDTEFCRRRTYYPKLSLVQIASHNARLVIDILSGVKMNSLGKILQNENVTKVMHSSRQDLEIFLHFFKKLPRNVFDTQIAANILGFGTSVGYKNLCNDLLNINLDKRMQNTDWLKRPLSNMALDYAIKDVEYLIPLHRELSRTISAMNLWNSYNMRIAPLLNQLSYEPNTEYIFEKMRLFNVNKKHMIALIDFREGIAQELDITRNFCASTDDLILICKNLPQSETKLRELNINGKIMHRRYMNRLLNLCIKLKSN